jgi:hypothetical protein
LAVGGTEPGSEYFAGYVTENSSCPVPVGTALGETVWSERAIRFGGSGDEEEVGHAVY